MKDFVRKNRFFSLCGLNCALCPMYVSAHCPGCGGGDGNQSCRIARCSLEHNRVEYCFQCGEYPCEKYAHIDEFDSFITHRNRKTDMEKAQRMGMDAYNAEQAEKERLLHTLLEAYNDGRKKSFYCMAVNLLETEDVRAALARGTEASDEDVSPKARYMVELLEKAAAEKGLALRMRRKK